MAPRAKKPKDIEQELRQAIQQSGLTGYALAKASGVSAGQIGRFLSEERTLTLTGAAKLATALGLHLSPVADPSPAAGAPAAHDDAILDAIRATTGRQPAKLANVFKTLQQSHQALTLGAFHDAIRTLRTAGRVELSPWTGAMYRLDSPETCLLVGREIMAYVAAR